MQPHYSAIDTTGSNKGVKIDLSSPTLTERRVATMGHFIRRASFDARQPTRFRPLALFALE
jgi:hypothetical protein